MTIVLGYDESPGARRALGYAIDLAKLLDDTAGPGLRRRTARPDGRRARRAHRGARRTRPGRAEHAVGTATAAGVATIVELVDEKPAQALLDSADKHDARLIVVGHLRGEPAAGAMLGSTPHKLLHWSSRPVLCVPPPPDGRERRLLTAGRSALPDPSVAVSRRG